jgi:hypothetical protein
MKLTRLAVLTLALVGLLAFPTRSSAGPLTLTIANGRVTLSAQDVPLRQILAEWERIGGLRIINRDRVPGATVTIELTDFPEEKAIETLLRPAAGFVAVVWAGQPAGASIYSRIIVMPGTAAPLLASVGGASSQGAGAARPQPQVQRRVLPDGRVINLIENANRPGDMTIVEDDDDPGTDVGTPAPMPRPPFGAPMRPGQPPGTATGGDPDQTDDQPPVQTPSTLPTVPARTLPAPGMLPAAKPATGQTMPPGPPKPPKPPGD